MDYSSAETNVDSSGFPVNCAYKNSSYYGIQGPTFDIVTGEIIIAQRGRYSIKGNLRLAVFNEDFNFAYHLSRSRILINGSGTSLVE